MFRYFKLLQYKGVEQATQVAAGVIHLWRSDALECFRPVALLGPFVVSVCVASNQLNFTLEDMSFVDIH